MDDAEPKVRIIVFTLVNSSNHDSPYKQVDPVNSWNRNRLGSYGIFRLLMRKTQFSLMVILLLVINNKKIMFR